MKIVTISKVSPNIRARRKKKETTGTKSLKIIKKSRNSSAAKKRKLKRIEVRKRLRSERKLKFRKIKKVRIFIPRLKKRLKVKKKLRRQQKHEQVSRPVHAPDAPPVSVPAGIPVPMHHVPGEPQHHVQTAPQQHVHVEPEHDVHVEPEHHEHDEHHEYTEPEHYVQPEYETQPDAEDNHRFEGSYELIETSPPTRFEKTWIWINQIAAQGNYPSAEFKPLYSQVENPYLEIRDINNAVIFSETETVQPVSFAAVIPMGRIWGINGSIITPDNVLLEDVSMDFSIGNNYANHPAISRWSPYPASYIPETVAALTFSESQNYFHWLYDVVVRLHLLQLSGIKVDKYVFSMRNNEGQSSNKAFQEQTLQILGIRPEQIIETHEQFHLIAEKVVVLSHTEQSGYPVWATHFLRKSFLYDRGLDVSGEGTEYIYISRGNASRRRILNEPIVLELLQAYGFKTYSLENMTVDEQIAIFSSAKVIVAPHGAGLANITFCKPGTTLIEIFTPNWIQSCYWKISNYTSLYHHSLLGAGVPFEGMNWSGEEDMIINIDQLKQVLTQIGI